MCGDHDRDARKVKGFIMVCDWKFVSELQQVRWTLHWRKNTRT